MSDSKLTVDKICKLYLDCSPAKRLSMAKDAIGSINEFCKANSIGEKEYRLLLNDYFKLFVSADRVCAYQEKDLFNEAFDLDFSMQEFYEMTNYGAAKNFVKQMKDILSSMDEKAQTDIFVLGCCVTSSDDKITLEEKALIESMLPQFGKLLFFLNNKLNLK